MGPIEIGLDGQSLTLQQIVQVAYAEDHQVSLFLTPQSKERVTQAHQYVLNKVQSEETFYGINTGFGVLSRHKISSKDLSQLQYNLIRSHCVGVGSLLSREQTRAMMLIRANCLASGHSGVAQKTIELIFSFLKHGITPLVPGQGSVGASGDLAPLSHLALALIGEGNVFYKNQKMSTQKALQECSLQPIKPGPKEGLALINGTAGMTALGALALKRAYDLAKTADIVGALSTDALLGSRRAFSPLVTQVRPHPGVRKAARNLYLLLENSELLKSHQGCEKVQDSYSLRCMPQVHGASRQVFEHVDNVLSIEFNAVTDNPILFPKEDDIISGGNFHGQCVAMSLDYLALGISELSSISERRMEKLMNPSFSGLPAFLTESPGLNSGLMMTQVTHAAITSENKIYCHPASIDSIPTSTDKEDHVSMGMTAGLKLEKIIENVTNALAIELMAGYQAIQLRRPLKSSPCLEKILHHLEQTIRPLKEDRVFSEDIAKVSQLIHDGTLVSSIESEIGELA